MLRKVYIISISALFIALMSIGTNISNSTNTTYVNNTYVNNTNISGGDVNHSNLTNLNWKNANHTMDYDFIMNRYNVTNTRMINSSDTIFITSNESQPFTSFDGNNYNPIFISKEDNTSVDGGTSPFITIRTYGQSQLPGFRTQAARGTIASPKALDREFPILRFSSAGYNGAAFTGSKGIFDFWSSEAWNTTSNPTYFTIGTTNVGSTTVTSRWQVRPNGNLQPTANDTYDIGTTGLNVKRIWVKTVAGGEFADKIGNEGYNYYDLFQFIWENKTICNPIFGENDEIVGCDNISISKRIPFNTTGLHYSAVELNRISGKWELSHGIGSSSSVAIIPADDELISDGRLVILGGYKAKVYGDIYIGDKLIVSDRDGVLTNAKGKSVPSIQYNFNTNQWVSVNLPASNNPDVYNKYDTAQGVSTTVVAIALESYTSQSTGVINVKVLNT